MRDTYQWRTFAFGLWATSSAMQTPKRIIIHRQGNPGAKAINALNWGNTTKAFSIHRYIEDDTVYGAIPLECHAYHVSEPRTAATLGYRTLGQYGERGDYDSIGIETVDLPGGAAGQEYHLSQETRITLLLVLKRLLEVTNLTPRDVWQHSDFDRWNRPHDLGDALSMGDLRADLTDMLAGREPWRTVQQYATGAPAPPSWNPTPVVDRYNEGWNDAIKAARSALDGLKEK